MEQSFILDTKFDCPVARQVFSFLATGHDCETGLQGENKCVIWLDIYTLHFWILRKFRRNTGHPALVT